MSKQETKKITKAPKKSKKEKKPVPFLKKVGLPEHYVRKIEDVDKGKPLEGGSGINAKNVEDLLRVVAQANHVDKWESLVYDKPEDDRLIIWPFDKILVAKNIKEKLPPAKKGQTKAQTKKERKKFYEYEIIDGGHRVRVAERLKLFNAKEVIDQDGNRTAPIPYTVVHENNPAERYLTQFKTNDRHGLRLDKDHRDNGIRVLAKVFNMSQKRLVEETGLDQTSISRIIKMKQRKIGERKKPTLGGKAGKVFSRSDAEAAKLASSGLEGFLTRLKTCCEEWPRLHRQVAANINALSKADKKHLVKYVEALQSMVTTFTNAYGVVLTKKAA